MDVHADRAASEIQFGHVYRPTHANTSLDQARFERRPPLGPRRRTGLRVRGRQLLQLRTRHIPVRVRFRQAGHPDQGFPAPGPAYPGPGGRPGRHEFRLSLRAGAGIPEAIAEGYRLNLPLRRIEGTAVRELEPLLAMDNPAVIVEAVKAAEDGSGDVVLRLYEAHGTRADVGAFAEFRRPTGPWTDLLERPVEDPSSGLGSRTPVSSGCSCARSS